MSTRLRLAGLFVALSAYRLCAAEDARLKELRSSYAAKFCEPAPHIALAKHLHDGGQRLLAFFILEGARKRFSRWDAEKDEGEWTVDSDGQPSFEQAFENVFLGKELFDNSKAAEEKLRKELEKSPRSVKLIQRLADVHISRREYAEAATLLEKLIELEPDVFGHAGALGEVLGLLSHDDESVRWGATEALREHAGTAFEPRLVKLLKDPDHRRRGAAAFIALRLRKSKAIPQLAPWLTEESQLLRFDVISAFAESKDPEARKLLEKPREREKHPYISAMLKNLDRTGEDE